MVVIMKGGDSVVEEYLTVAQIAEKTNVPDTTVRRYLKLFETFFKSKAYGRTKKYSPDAVEIILVISKLYEESKSTSEIRERLQSTVLQIIDIEKPEHVPVTINTTSDIAILLEAQETIVQAFREEIEEMRKGYNADNEKMVKEIAALRTEIVALRDIHQQEKERQEASAKLSLIEKIRKFFSFK